jgi:malate dehydrogenase (oxaloacetate-decarboxylating)
MVQASEPATDPEEPKSGRSPPADPEEEARQTEELGLRAVELARFYQGKIETIPSVPVRNLSDFSVWYTPGIAAVSRAIHARPEESFELTGRWNTIAIVTDGSRVLGLGDMGPEAALPVMEGKALLFKYLGGVDAIPIPIRATSPAEIVSTVERIAPAFGGINLEDIASPKCFYILEELQQKLPIPIWHDDQLGTAAATLAGLLNALAVTDRDLRSIRTVLFGAGAANLVTARLLLAMGHDPHALTILDQKGVLEAERDDMDALSLHNRWKYRLALQTDGGGRRGGPAEALREADVLLAASTPDPHTVRPEWIRSMRPDPIVFALANPVPEIWPSAAHEAGAKVVATGRSDFPNQVNNSLIFPAVFRGVLDARARKIPDEIVIAAAQALAGWTRSRDLTVDHRIPTMEEAEAFPHVAAAVATKCVELGIARRRLSAEEFLERARQRMERPHSVAAALAHAGLIRPMPSPSPSPEAP